MAGMTLGKSIFSILHIDFSDGVRPLNLASTDLNLLVAFDALMAERSVTRAGQRIGLGQPGMSAALARDVRRRAVRPDPGKTHETDDARDRIACADC